MSVSSAQFTPIKIYNDSAKHNIVINPNNIDCIQELDDGKPRLYLSNGASPYFDIRKDMSAEDCAKEIANAQQKNQTTGQVIDLTV